MDFDTGNKKQEEEGRGHKANFFMWHLFIDCDTFFFKHSTRLPKVPPKPLTFC
jgi:hypothetical protein